MKALIRQQLAALLWDNDPANTGEDELVEALLPVVEALIRKARAGAWDEGYASAEADADEEPYSDRPERVTWQPRQNPYRAAVRQCYPCYCLPGPARCDDPYNWCDRRPS